MARDKKQTEDAQHNNAAEPQTDNTEYSEEQTGDRQEAPQNSVQRGQRQSAPKPTAMDELNRLQMQQGMQNGMMGQGLNPLGAVDGMRAVASPIKKEAIHKATLTLQKYKEGKANLENRIIQNEQWYKMRHWECMRGKDAQVNPVSGWLFNSIANKHADAMDSFPAPNILPREEGDKAEAEMLTSIIPVVLDQNDFEATYSEASDYKLKMGTGVYGVFWDPSKMNIGDISITSVDLLRLYWEPGVKNIQQSRNFFAVELVDNDVLVEQYPQLQNKLGSSTIDVAKYIYDDTIDTSEKSVVVDWYYKRRNSQGRQILHYCKYVNDEVLFATENDPQYADRGWYDHGKYPFVFDPLFRVAGTPTGFGYIDVGKSAQEYIDRGNQAILQNMLSNARPRHFIRSDGSVNESEYADMTKDFVHVDGNLGQDSILPIQGKPLDSTYINVIAQKIDELKETTGNRDVATGGTTAGVTAASGIAAMQEASSKLSRDNNRAQYRAFRELVLMVIELIRQFYDLPRCFRIMGNEGMVRFVQYSNEGIQPQQQGMDFGVDMGVRIPLFDVEVTAEKKSPYSKLSQNELALQFYSAGFFDPTRADQALACLDMMDFDRKDAIMQKIQQNGGMLQQMMMLAQIADNATGGMGGFTQGIAAQYGMAAPPPADNPAQAKRAAGKQESLGGDASTESHVTKNAREATAERSQPT